VSGPLETLAEASLAVEEAEAALGEGEATRAEEALDRAEAVLAELRERWRAMGPAERAVVGPAAKGVRERAEAGRRRLPRRRALSEGAPEVDPEQDVEPDAPAGTPPT
jgi:hypothetical protein